MNIRSILATATLLLLAGPAFAAFFPVPEPSTWALFGIGGVALGITRIRRKK